MSKYIQILKTFWKAISVKLHKVNYCLTIRLERTTESDLFRAKTIAAAQPER